MRDRRTHSAEHGANNVVTALNDNTRNILQNSCVLEELTISLEETSVYLQQPDVVRMHNSHKTHGIYTNKIVALNSGECNGKVIIFSGAGDVRRIDIQTGSGHLPARPSTSAFDFLLLVGSGQTAMVREHEITALGLRNGLEILVPLIREQEMRALLVEPDLYGAFY